MNNFGVIELASTKTVHAPGWAYVPDTAINPAQTIQPSNRKRARNQANLNPSDVSARKDAKVRKELEALERDNQKDANIPIPARKNASSRVTKSTANVRKILQSQKTFANHLDDYRAALALAESNPAAAAAANAALGIGAKVVPSKASSPAPAAAAGASGNSKRSAAASAASKSKKKGGAAPKRGKAGAANPKTEQATDTDVEMVDVPGEEEGQGTEEGPEAGEESAAKEGADSVSQQPEAPPPEEPPQPSSYPPDGTILPAYQRPPPPSHPADSEPLLMSAVPPFPTDDELRALMTAPPLSYLEARATWGDEDENGSGLVRRYPPREFCLVCGYWGRVRCMKCGGRVCALDCLEVHREECITRYGL